MSDNFNLPDNWNNMTEEERKLYAFNYFSKFVAPKILESYGVVLEVESDILPF